MQKKPLCVIQFQFRYVSVSNHYNMQSLIITQQLASQTRTFGVENVLNALIPNRSCQVLYIIFPVSASYKKK